jgi:hypothetical protein
LTFVKRRLRSRNPPIAPSVVIPANSSKNVNVTAHPSAGWTLQQLREAIADADEPKYVIHDRYRIFARRLNDSIRALGLEVLRSPERSAGSVRTRSPMSETHLRSIRPEWVTHYREGIARTGFARTRDIGGHKVGTDNALGSRSASVVSGITARVWL